MRGGACTKKRRAVARCCVLDTSAASSFGTYVDGKFCGVGTETEHLLAMERADLRLVEACDRDNIVEEKTGEWENRKNTVTKRYSNLVQIVQVHQPDKPKNQHKMSVREPDRCDSFGPVWEFICTTIGIEYPEEAVWVSEHVCACVCARCAWQPLYTSHARVPVCTHTVCTECFRVVRAN